MQASRSPAVSGMFYEGSKDKLERQLKSLFSKAKSDGKFSIVISPHAGYVYSGKTAASAVSSLKECKRFIILGPNHTGLGEVFSVMSNGSWKTPLGECMIDSDLAKRLKSSCSFLTEDELAHSQEHSIEVQLPILKHRFREFKFVPICIMNTDYSEEFLEKCQKLGKVIADMMKGENMCVVTSSDFSHYLPQDVADMKDEAAVKRILKLDVAGFFRELEEMDASVCGFGPIAVSMSAAKELHLRGKLIEKTSSGEKTGDYSAVVAYYAIGFY